jgi:FMN reductase
VLLREADGVILASPGYHGSVSGLPKNALDYIEDMRSDARPISMPGRSAASSAPMAGRHPAPPGGDALDRATALRGWPTPLGIAINTAETGFDERGECLNRRSRAISTCWASR